MDRKACRTGEATRGEGVARDALRIVTREWTRSIVVTATFTLARYTHPICHF